jgi:hypothetical protein
MAGKGAEAKTKPTVVTADSFIADIDPAVLEALITEAWRR